jgi:alanine racemase
LDKFIAVLQSNGVVNYPIHIEFETGMNRLGFQLEDIEKLFKRIVAEKCLYVKSVFSHLSDADNQDKGYTLQQLEQFNKIQQKVTDYYLEKVDFHILNSAGVLNFGNKAAYNMIRLGIGIFGYASERQLKPCISWKTTIAQLNTVEKGKAIGYGKTYITDKEMQIATLRIGYADGFRRSLSNGKGHVIINNQACPVVGNVCMDMTMVDVTGLQCQEGDEVEIIGTTQTMEDFAQQLNTIPYEIMTSINKRVARIYVR